MCTQAPRRQSAISRVERLVERAMTIAVEEYDDDLVKGRTAAGSELSS
jgi:hypothetical protein